ncbi:MAG TPA: cation diffusion facilitator family transporter [Afifellaceae bacterium]|nr:cation diffusion facilitator family transporter [Afifellaceae bacterium]
MTQTLKIAYGSIVVGIVVFLLKCTAYWITGSVALLSDALESTVNMATAVAALVAIRIAMKPPDADHPYGHHKAEFFSALLEGVMIIVAALIILQEAFRSLIDPRMLTQPFDGLLVNGIAGVINGIWCWFLISRGRKLRSPALVADGRHLFTDVLSSGGVILGVALAVLLDWPILDPILAALVAVNILWSGWNVMKQSVSGLLDESVSDDQLNRIKELISQEAEGALEAHDVKTRHAGRATFIDFHLVVPGDMPVSEAHDICDRIERSLRQEVDGATITIHVEPEDKAKHSGVIVL